jgi:hypothetical protein
MYVFQGGINVKKNSTFGGFVPSAYPSGYIVAEIGHAGSGLSASTTTAETLLTSNMYWDGTNWKYGVTDEASVMSLGSDGTFRWQTAPSGTAGNNVSYTLRMTLNNGGNLVLGNFTPSAWSSSYNGFELGAAGNGMMNQVNGNNLWFLCNSYWDGSNFKYVTTARAWLMTMSVANGNYTIYHSASGTAGNNITLLPILASNGTGNTWALENASSQTGIGFTFPATQTASSNANTLDDYEEGSVNLSSGTANITLNNQLACYYAKVGQLVYATGYVEVINNTGVGVNAMTISGLPFTCSTAFYGMAQCHYDGVHLPLYGYVNAGTTNALVAWTTNIPNGATRYFMYTFVYRASA